MTLDPESAAHPLFATACCSIVAAPKKRASHQSFSLLASVLLAASSDLAFASERLLQSPGHLERNWLRA